MFCTPTHFYVGIVEILAESDCEYATEDEAWGEYGYNLDGNRIQSDLEKDECGHCVNTDVREFLAQQKTHETVLFSSRVIFGGLWWSLPTILWSNTLAGTIPRRSAKILRRMADGFEEFEL